MNKMKIYLDNAATSFPKPKNVVREVANCLENYCGNAGRGSHKLSLLAANKLYDCKEALCALFNAPAPESIAFVPSCTYGLNLIVKGILRRGDHVLISDMEHNAVLRPLEKLKQEGKITYDVFPVLAKASQSNEELLAGIKSLIKPTTKLLICNHQSNICSFALPIDKIGRLCKENHIIFALDTAQSAGHLEIDMQKMNIDFLSAPGHKGLYGVQGSAFIAINNQILLDTIIEGGNGINSLEYDVGDSVPERYEVGTLPLPAIVGLHEGIKFINKYTTNAIHYHEKELFCHLRDGLLNINGVNVLATDFAGSTLSFTTSNLSVERVCAFLDEANIFVRGGFHCTALAHRSLKTEKTGTVRVSFGIFNTKNDIDKLLSIIDKNVS